MRWLNMNCALARFVGERASKFLSINITIGLITQGHIRPCVILALHRFMGQVKKKLLPLGIGGPEKMAKYIDVEPLIKDGWMLQRYNSGDGYANQEHASLKDIPPADVRPAVRGKWVSGIGFTIPYPETKRGKLDWNRRFSLNAYWSGKHYRARAQDAKYIHALTMEAMKRAKVKKDLFVVPVEVVFRWDDKLDIDNHGALGKMIVDAMKKTIIQDDNPRWVRKVTHEFWDGGQIGVEVRPV